MLKGKEDFDIELNVKFVGRSVTVTGSKELELDTIDDYKRGFLTVEATGLNHGFTFDDGKGNLWKKN